MRSEEETGADRLCGLMDRAGLAGSGGAEFTQTCCASMQAWLCIFAKANSMATLFNALLAGVAADKNDEGEAFYDA